jgi:hypothetical protein
MLKKLFALATMTAITGLGASVAVAGCTSTTQVTDVADTGTDAKAPVKKDAAAAEEEDASTDPGVCPKPGDVTEADVQQAFDGPWKGPGAPKNVCLQGDIDKVRALFAASASVKFADLKAALSGNCASCVFTPNTAATWGPLVEFKDGVYQNYAACYGVTTNDNCGKNLAYFDICLNALCDDAECGSAQAVTACQRKAGAGGCKAFTSAFSTACGQDNLEKLDKQCGNIFQVMAVTCGGGLDSGLDAAAPK